jgi:hypothetical protein
MHTVAQHFERSEPQVYAVYDKIIKAARACGLVGEDPKKTSIHLRRRASANRWHLNVKLEHPRDVDATVIGWIKQAYGLAE